MAVKAKPDGYHAVTPYLVVDGAARLIDFLQEVFDAEEVERFAAPGDRIGHAEMRIGDSVVMLGDAHGEHKPLQTMLYVYVDDADATYQRALAAGAVAGAAAGRPVLWRPQRRGARSVRQPVVDRDPHRGRAARRTEAACAGKRWRRPAATDVVACATMG